MPVRAREPPLDYATLAEFLTAVGYPVRLELLHKLRFPHTVGELKVTPHRDRGEGSAERPLARQSVQQHLDMLVQTGLVVVDDVEQGGRSTPVYQVNPARLYALAEDVRRLSVIHAGTGKSGDQTGTLDRVVEAEDVTGPRLVLVHGVYEGKAFPLERSALDEADGWIIGRRKDVGVPLDYDPFVSSSNSVVRNKRGKFTVQDHVSSKNGTSVNWRLLPEGQSRALKPGDVVGVGRSLLVFVND